MAAKMTEFLMVPVTRTLKRAVQAEAARRQMKVAEFIRSRVAFCLPENTGKPVSERQDGAEG